MDLSDIRDYCLAKTAVTEDIKWEHHLCFNVGGKMFLITSPDEVPVNASLKVDEDEFGRLCMREGVRPAPHLARYHWVRIDDLGRFSPKEWRHYLDESYRLVSSKLSKAERKRLGIQE